MGLSDPHPPQLGQKTKFFDRFNLRAPLNTNVFNFPPSHVFTLSLDLLEAASFALSPLAFALAGHFPSLATNVRFYKPVKFLLSKLASTDSLPEILAELEEELVMLACHRFGHTVVIALLEAELPPATRESLVERFQGRIAELACHPVCCAVMEVLLRTAGDGQQAAIIEEVCTVTTNQADMAVVSLTKDKQGHAIVLTMLKVENMFGNLYLTVFLPRCLATSRCTIC